MRLMPLLSCCGTLEVGNECVPFSAQPRKYPEEERDIMREDEIASLPTEEERRREVSTAAFCRIYSKCPGD